MKIQKQSGFGMIVVIAILAILFIVMLSAGARGYGYPGYGGYYHSPSFFYWGGPSYYSGYNVRDGSVGGPGHRGGGIRGGGK